jgi:hypothetical protein
MPVSAALRRLLRVRELIEEDRRRALESALAELIELENALASATVREVRGRQLVRSGVLSGELADRVAGFEESRSAVCHQERLSVRITDAKSRETQTREVYLSARIERRQAETLIEEAEARDSLKGARRGQRQLDDWHLARAQNRNERDQG